MFRSMPAISSSATQRTPSRLRPISPSSKSLPRTAILFSWRSHNPSATAWMALLPRMASKPFSTTFPSLAKTNANYANSQLIKMEAVLNGYSEGIALDVDGFVSEGSGENLFLIRDGRAYTPGISASILSGITRRSARRLLREHGIEVEEARMPREALYMADEIFFTGTAAEITPVRSVDRIPVGSGKPGPITRHVQQRFQAIVKGEEPDPFGWLTPVGRASRPEPGAG